MKFVLAGATPQQLLRLLPKKCPCCEAVPVERHSVRFLYYGEDWEHQIKFECGAEYHVSNSGNGTHIVRKPYRVSHCCNAQEIAEKLLARRGHKK